jgi:hypothetical protein
MTSRCRAARDRAPCVERDSARWKFRSAAYRLQRAADRAQNYEDDRCATSPPRFLRLSASTASLRDDAQSRRSGAQSRAAFELRRCATDSGRASGGSNVEKPLATIDDPLTAMQLILEWIVANADKIAQKRNLVQRLRAAAIERAFRIWTRPIRATKLMSSSLSRLLRPPLPSVENLGDIMQTGTRS